MTPGMFILHPPGVPHGDLANDKYSLYHVLLTSDQPLGWPEFGHDLEGSPLHDLLRMIVNEWYSNRIQREAYLRHCAALLDLLMKRCAVEQEGTQVARNVVAEVCGRFRRGFYATINMGDVASDLQISRSTLYAYFRQVLGRTPVDVLDAIRLKHAVYLLLHSELSVAEVAKGAGFCSASHLGRKLRTAYRATASQIRQRGAEAEPGSLPIAKTRRR
ncbi:AraC family transcriptional regulator [Fimbriimonas ginsengisoli Gsoil 348]|uniref:AraC family transcriptional regulator n=2 Tax=Fimbriimonas ginsengisoli TaxID=1005039 RepID=A0A068NRP3_FIMGI|nr:AraC family transcriptional regulator [Fimbriimonas ginsengisoli Gsoil 348]